MKKTNKLKKYVAAAAVLVLSVVTVVGMGPEPALAAPNQIDGNIYWDQNNNGVRDGGEPGLPGIVVGFGYPPKTAITDSDGNYSITSTSGIGRVMVHSGWYRSQCNSMNCAAGGAGNNLPVATQFINLAGVDGEAGATFNVGLVPDWGGGYPIPATPLSSNPVDAALRLSYLPGPGEAGSGLCADVTSTRICNVGDRPGFYVTILNQGTSSLSGVEFLVEMPIGHVVDDSSWTNPNNVQHYAHPDAGTVTVVEPYDPAKGYGRYRINGTLPAGASTAVEYRATVTSDAPASPMPYATGDPYDKQGIARIVKMDQAGDWDSDFCEADGQDGITGSCEFTPVGSHNKTESLDHSDAAGWSVSGTYAAPVYDPSLQVVLAPGQANPVLAGQPVNFIVKVCNNSTGDAGIRNIQIQNTVPNGMSFDPGSNQGWSESGGVLTTRLASQVLPGECTDIPLVLTVNSDMTPADNGTPLLLDNAQIVSFTTTRADTDGTFLTATDSDPTNNADSADITVMDAPDPGPGPNPGNDPTPTPDPSADETLADTGISRTLLIILAALLIAPLVITAARSLIGKLRQGSATD